MSADRLRRLSRRLDAESRRSAVFRRARTVFLLIACLGLAAGVLDRGGFWPWAALIGFGLCAIAYGRQAMIDFGFVKLGGVGRPTHIVTATDHGISCRSARGVTESVSWASLRGVVLEAVDGVPVGDVYWLLIGDDGTGCMVAIEAEGADELLESLQQRLPGFDNEAVVSAVTMLEGRVMVWQRDSEGIPDTAARPGRGAVSK